ncbi:MAG TPA: hypothetical protein VE954_35775 [Oligoflexus sp.]|uniref:hypothetical protein n=1 Tax=Oligoflexus sp. TaxID=1971216 RepID=UPI002D671706|nr:hypothetical protein [Oligoflexus sp.]HYX38493.1 hypothetical protein [Oligoflexus sp.]
MFPNALRGRKDVFLGDFSTNSAWKFFPHKGIFQRLQNGKRLRLLYLLKQQKHTRPTWGFSDQVQDAVDKHFERHYDDIGAIN